MKIYPTEQNAFHLRFYLVSDNPNNMAAFLITVQKIPYTTMSHTMFVKSLVCRLLNMADGSEAQRFVRVHYQSDGIWDIDIFGPAFKILASHHEAYIQGYETKSLVEWLSLLLLQPEAVSK